MWDETKDEGLLILPERAGSSASPSEINGDVILLSSDDISIHVHSSVLRKHCSFIDDLFQCSSVGQPSDQPIPLGAPAHIIRDFLKLVQSGSQRPQLPFKVSIDEIQEILGICDRLDASILADDILDSLASGSREEPWKLFCLAGRCRHLPLARAALEVMDNGGSNPATRLPRTQFGDFPPDIDPEWLRELVNRRLVMKPTWNEETHRYDTVCCFDEWASVANNFSPRF